MYGGADKNNMQYCKLAKFLQLEATPIYETIDNCCLFGLLSERRGRGVTFLLPDPKTQKEIASLVRTDTPKAVSKIKALVLPMYLPSTSEWASPPSALTNELKHSISATVDGKSVKIGKLTATLNTDYRRLHDTSTTAVWNIDGPMPVTGASAEVAGGNDSEFRTYNASSNAIPHQVGGNYEYLVDRTAADVCFRIDAKYGVQGSSRPIDAFTHLGTSLERFLQLSGNHVDLCNVLKVKCASPLDALFALSIVPKNLRSAWEANINNDSTDWDKSSVYRAGLAASGLDAAWYANVRKIKTDMLNTKPNLSDICSKYMGVYASAFETLPADIKASAARVFGSDGQFIEYWAAKGEFCALYTGEFVTAYKAGNIGTIKRIVKDFKNMYLPHLGGSASGNDYSKTRIASDAKRMETHLSSKVNYCVLLSVLVNVYTCMAGGSVEELSSVPGVCPGSVRPNNLKQTSCVGNVFEMQSGWM
jgi:hypothetical protein